MVRRALGLALALLALGLVAGCGSMSADEYRSELTAACSELDDTIRGLPARAAEEDLTTDQLDEIADQKTADYVDRIEALDPPTELAGAHDELVSLSADPLPDDVGPEDAVSYLERVTDAYGALGADECEARSQRSVDGLRDAIESLEDAPPAS